MRTAVRITSPRIGSRGGEVEGSFQGAYCSGRVRLRQLRSAALPMLNTRMLAPFKNDEDASVPDHCPHWEAGRRSVMQLGAFRQ